MESKEESRLAESSVSRLTEDELQATEALEAFSSPMDDSALDRARQRFKRTVETVNQEDAERARAPEDTDEIIWPHYGSAPSRRKKEGEPSYTQDSPQNRDSLVNAFSIGKGQKSPGTASKRPYGQVTRMAQDLYVCPDGTTFNRSYLAYKHLRTQREREPELEIATTLSRMKQVPTSPASASKIKPQQQLSPDAVRGPSSAHTTPSPGNTRRRKSVHAPGHTQMTPPHAPVGPFNLATIHDRQLALSGLPASTTLYSLCRLWIEHEVDQHAAYTPAKREQETAELQLRLDAVAPPRARYSTAQPRSSKQSNVNTLLAGTPDVSTEALLETLLGYCSEVKRCFRELHQRRLQEDAPRLQILQRAVTESGAIGAAEVTAGGVVSATGQQLQTPVSKGATADPTTPHAPCAEPSWPAGGGVNAETEGAASSSATGSSNPAGEAATTRAATSAASTAAVAASTPQPHTASTQPVPNNSDDAMQT